MQSFAQKYEFAREASNHIYDVTATKISLEKGTNGEEKQKL